MKYKDLDLKNCPIRKSLDILGSKWSFLILLNLQEKKRYGELKKGIPDVSEKILIERLKLLEQKGFIIRKDFKEIPPKVEYTITPLGSKALNLAPTLKEIGSEL